MQIRLRQIPHQNPPEKLAMVDIGELIKAPNLKSPDHYP